MQKDRLEEIEHIDLQFNKRGGLLPVIVQENSSKEILMLGYINHEAFEKTLSSRLATFWSTSRNCLWTKGETSGDFLYVLQIKVDCDQDTILYLVELKGSGTCHTRNLQGDARKSCFYRQYDFQQEKLIFLEE